MKITSILPLLVACTLSTSAFAQSSNMKSDETKAMPGMDMKGMSMDNCEHMSGMKGMDMKQMDAEKCKTMKSAKSSKAHSDEMHVADGVVKQIDPQGMVTLKHGPVKSLGWPAMTMGFSVKDKALMHQLAVGKKVHVEFSKQGDQYVIRSVK